MTEENDFEASVQVQRVLQSLQLEYIRNSEARAAVEHEQLMADNAPEAKREWQRHQVAMSVLNALLIGRPAGDLAGDNADSIRRGYAIAAYDMAEAMMQERERRK